MKNPSSIALSVAPVAIVSGCATASKDVPTAYISPIQFQAYDCAQLTAESVRLQQRVTQLGGRLDEAAANDKAIATAGGLLFWPALFALGGTKQQEAEYGRLKGEFEAIQQAAIGKKCEGLVAPTPLQAPTAETKN